MRQRARKPDALPTPLISSRPSCDCAIWRTLIIPSRSIKNQVPSRVFEHSLCKGQTRGPAPTEGAGWAVGAHLCVRPALLRFFFRKPSVPSLPASSPTARLSDLTPSPSRDVCPHSLPPLPPRDYLTSPPAPLAMFALTPCLLSHRVGEGGLPTLTTCPSRDVCPHSQPLSHRVGEGGLPTLTPSPSRDVCPHPQPLSHRVGEGGLPTLTPAPLAMFALTPCLLSHRAIICPHPQPLSHRVGEGGMLATTGMASHQSGTIPKGDFPDNLKGFEGLLKSGQVQLGDE
ncbi:MAG: hypothetical protein KatS3mg016_1832 [Fimbriimonadales bacterium]|nr:MAG: hypothetical protein KatS3mg016_1832 [Fimbriimonadales bacterium]